MSEGTSRLLVVLKYVGCLFGVLALLYGFFVSLILLSTSFRLIPGPAGGEAFSSSAVLQNPLGALMVGILGTVILQSSSTSTSIVVSMAASELISVEQGVFIVMGSNIGTSVTSSIVAFTSSLRHDEFKRSFACATVHDLFNFLSVFVLFPLEVSTHGIARLVKFLTSGMLGESKTIGSVKFLSAITKPVASLVVNVSSGYYTDLAKGEAAEGARAVKSFFKQADPGLNDMAIGWITLGLALVMLVVCLLLLVAVLKKVLLSRAGSTVKSALHRWGEEDVVAGGTFCRRLRKGLIRNSALFMVGCVVTLLVQSSSVVTSLLTPLAATDVLPLELAMPLVVGANIGTTGTAILASLATSNVYLALQVALAHLTFNILGGIIWFIPPITRRLPLAGARLLGSLACKRRWVAIVYVLVCFLLLPGGLFALSLLHWRLFLVVFVPVVALTIGACPHPHTLLHRPSISVLITMFVVYHKCRARLPFGLGEDDGGDTDGSSDEENPPVELTRLSGPGAPDLTSIGEDWSASPRPTSPPTPWPSTSPPSPFRARSRSV